MSEQQSPEATIQAMQVAANAFYRDAVAIGNHPFIEFAGLMNEYINACREAAASGIDFTSCNTHTGLHLPLHGHQVDYINEKLECIFTGRSVVSRATDRKLRLGETVMVNKPASEMHEQIGVVCKFRDKGGEPGISVSFDGEIYCFLPNELAIA